MKARAAALVVVLCGACAPPSSLEQVRVVLARSAPLPPGAVLAVASSSPSACVIAGSGERAAPDADAPELDLFADASASAPALVVNTPGSVAVSWSELPPYGGGDHRARATLSAQRLVRWSAWADLGGRGFQIKTRAFAVAHHVWAIGGSRAELLGASGGKLVLRVATALESPERLEVTTTCANVVYQPSVLPATHERDGTPTGLKVENLKPTLDLSDAPEGGAVASLVLPADTTLRLDVMEARGPWLRVASEYEGVGFDGWVPSASVVQPPGYRMAGHSYTTHCGGVSVGRSAPSVVLGDTPLYVGAEPSPLAGAVVEAGAKVQLGADRRGEFVAFRFYDGEISAPEGAQMWIDERAVAP